jgi:alpha-ketoglutarate-dependent 2,4-dichlorophenoxyacetate dioxygenase
VTPTLAVTELHPLFAAEVHSVDLRRTDAALVREIVATMDRYAVCVFRHDRALTDDEHIAFSALLGPLETLKLTGGKPLRLPHLETIDQGNLDENGEIYPDDDRRLAFKRANRLWHTDLSFAPVRATYSLLSAHTIPPSGGETEFADMRAAYAALPELMRGSIADVVAEHSYWYSRVAGGGPEPTAEERSLRPPAQHRLVHVHPTSGRTALYLASHASHIVGWPLDEGRATLRELMAFATDPRFVYRHTWRVGDVVIWDNLATMHRATPFDDRTFKRDVRRTTVVERKAS